MWLIPLVNSYLLGSIPFGFLITLAVRKTDIRKCGSGNIGATNVTRVLGRNWGIFVFFLDFLKGAASLALAYLFFSGYPAWLYIGVAFASVAGHNWSIFLKFTGGKGVSTSIGVIFGLSLRYPELVIPLIISLCVWLVVFFIFKYVSLASLLAAFSFFILSFVSLPKEFKLFAFILFFFILMRHRANMVSLWKRKEKRF